MGISVGCFLEIFKNYDYVCVLCMYVSEESVCGAHGVQKRALEPL